MEWPALAIGLLFATAMAAKLIHEVRGSRRRRGVFDEAPPTTIEATPSDRTIQITGRVKVVGAAAPSPLHGATAAFSRIHTDGRRSIHAAAPAFRLERLEQWAEVELEDDTGRVRIDPSAARVELDPDRHEPREHYTDLVGATRPAIDAFIAERGLADHLDEHGERWKHLHLREWIIEDGARIAVLGRVETGDGPYRGARVLRARRVRRIG